ncbi:glycosyltransferase [Geobacter benzoatilyticus]|uniref:Glycosyltransferase n=1 Tax=Geobacter benzoatilyticus TaxID=2815309 RepID=A0ABX7Q1L9_9BACT|nr:glycosyltransferase [Geobacter benzoatilyticus]QSV44940.1 glycosyltransferase [Geobacter benzoatilyticus]
MPYNPFISVVIATCNRADYLRTCLNSIVNQTVPRHLFEVIVVNDGSTDQTAKVLEEFVEADAVNLNVIHQPNAGVSAARNAGVATATAPYIGFTDDDCILPPNWLQRIINTWESVEGDIAGIGGPLDTVIDNGDSLAGHFIRYLDEFNYIPVITQLVVRPVHVTKLKGNEEIAYLRTSNASFKRSCLESINGFDVSFRRPGGEDPDLCYRLIACDYRFRIISSLVVSHHSRESLGAYFRTLRNYVTGDVKKSRKRHMYQHPVIIRSYALLPLQKLMSFLLSIIAFPCSVYKLARDGAYTPFEALIFPFIVILSKQYAFFVSINVIFQKH